MGGVLYSLIVSPVLAGALTVSVSLDLKTRFTSRRYARVPTGARIRDVKAVVLIYLSRSQGGSARTNHDLATDCYTPKHALVDLFG